MIPDNRRRRVLLPLGNGSADPPRPPPLPREQETTARGHVAPPLLKGTKPSPPTPKKHPCGLGKEGSKEVALHGTWTRKTTLPIIPSRAREGWALWRGEPRCPPDSLWVGVPARWKRQALPRQRWGKRGGFPLPSHPVKPLF